MIRQFCFCLLLAIAIIPVPARADPQQPYSMSPELIQSVPEGQEIVGPYNQPRWAAHGRFSSTTDVYVLPPYDFSVDLDYEGTFPRHGTLRDHLFTQEFELGLPHRFQIAYENDFEVIGPHAQETIQCFEFRYALADWGKIPLNPTLFAEYHFGLGKNYADQGDDPGEVENNPDSIEGDILFGQQLTDKVEWALDVYREQELGGQREWENGFSQAFTYAIRDEYLKVGLEMLFDSRTEAGDRRDTAYEFDIGPSLTCKPGRRIEIDFAPLFGTTAGSPAVNVFAVFSYDFGNVQNGGEIEKPISRQNH